jgi:hypothetical protein
MFPILVIAIGIAVLVFGNRLAVLGAAVGALLGVGLLHLFPGQSAPLLELAIPILLAVIGFFLAGFAKGIVNIVLMVLGALAGAAIMQGFLDLFSLNSVLLDLFLVVVGGVIGWVLVTRFKDWAMIILAGLVGGLLVTRGLSSWLPFLQGALGTLLVIVLAGVGIALQGGLTGGRKTSG